MSENTGDTTLYLPGDILFYFDNRSDVIDNAISLETGSKLVHVAIAISAAQKIEAIMSGVMLTPIQDRDVGVSFRYGSHPGAYLNRGLAWLHSMLGQPYGVEDFVEAVLYRVVHGLDISWDNHYDCSALATEFLQISGGISQLTGINPHTVTPAMLYTYLTGNRM